MRCSSTKSFSMSKALFVFHIDKAFISHVIENNLLVITARLQDFTKFGTNNEGQAALDDTIYFAEGFRPGLLKVTHVTCHPIAQVFVGFTTQ